MNIFPLKSVPLKSHITFITDSDGCLMDVSDEHIATKLAYDRKSHFMYASTVMSHHTEGMHSVAVENPFQRLFKIENNEMVIDHGFANKGFNSWVDRNISSHPGERCTLIVKNFGAGVHPKFHQDMIDALYFCFKDIHFLLHTYDLSMIHRVNHDQICYVARDGSKDYTYATTDTPAWFGFTA